MRRSLPLFPLGTVLFPGLVLPLHIFEERYRALVRDLLAGPGERREFGVIAIREGRETGVAGVTALHEIGCAAAIREVTEHADGRFDLVTVGMTRFRLLALQEPQPYLVGEVAELPEVAGKGAEVTAAVREVQRGFSGYLDALAAQGPATITVPALPDDPLLLSYLVAAAMVVDLPDRQSLLAQPDAVSRLDAERRLLARETALLTSLGTTPAPDLRSSPYSPN
jgi:uncharacterized protein